MAEAGLSRFLRAVRAAERNQSAPRVDWNRDSRPFKVVSVTSNKGGVGKTTLACNLAVYIRALQENLPILILTLDDQLVLDRMFSMDGVPPANTLVNAISAGDLSPAMKLGQFGIRYIPPSRSASKLKGQITDLFHLQRVLQRTQWRGLIIIDTKSDFEILTQNAVMASDLVIVVVKDSASLTEAQRVFDFLEYRNRPRDTARIVLSLVDLRIKFKQGPADILEFLLSEIRRRGYPLFESFMSRSAKIEALHTNPEARMQSIMHGAPNSVAHRQMAHLADEVLAVLGMPHHESNDTSDFASEPIARMGRSEPARPPGQAARVVPPAVEAQTARSASGEGP
jgi:cellulose biosynthesis protein BcsQ